MTETQHLGFDTVKTNHSPLHEINPLFWYILLEMQQTDASRKEKDAQIFICAIEIVPFSFQCQRKAMPENFQTTS